MKTNYIKALFSTVHFTEGAEVRINLDKPYMEEDEVVEVKDNYYIRLIHRETRGGKVLHTFKLEKEGEKEIEKKEKPKKNEKEPELTKKEIKQLEIVDEPKIEINGPDETSADNSTLVTPTT